MSSFASPSSYLGGAIEPVTDGITSETVSQQPHIDGVAKIIISIIISVFIAAVAIYFSYLWIRRRSNQIRLDDTAEGLDDGPIPLVDLPPLPGSPGASPYISSNPDFSTTELPNPRPLNDRTMGLSSHPPSMTDLATAREASSSKVCAQEDTTVSLAGPPSWPSIVFQDNQEQTSLRPPCQSTPRPDEADDSQRHNIMIEFDNDSSGSASDETIRARSDLPPLPPAGPGIETMPEVLRGYDQGHTAPNFELLVPSTIKEESIPSISKGPGAERNVGLAGNDSGFGPMTPNLQVPEAQFHKEHDAGPLGQPHTASQSSHDGNDKGPMQGREMKVDDGDEYDKPSSQIANPHPPFEGVVYGSHDNQQFLNRDEEYDLRDPRYDVLSAVRRFGKKDKGPFRPDSAQVTRPLSNDNELQPPPTAKDTEGQYACLSRDYTNASMVPAPLNLLVQRNNTIHETSPSAAAIGHHFFRRPSSGARVDIPSLEPEIETQRPRSFVIREWPPQSDAKTTFDNVAARLAMWHTPPSEEIIERSRRAREQLEWEEGAQSVVLQKARDAGESLSDEEVARRVRRMYERSSRFTLEPTTYRPPTPTAVPCSGRVGAQRAGSMYLAASRDDDTARQEPAFASSQVLPLAATAASVTAQDGSRSVSPSVSDDGPSLSPLQCRRLRRSYQQRDLSRSI